MKSTIFFTTLIAMVGLVAPFESFAVDAERQAEVAQRGELKSKVVYGGVEAGS